MPSCLQLRPTYLLSRDCQRFFKHPAGHRLLSVINLTHIWRDAGWMVWRTRQQVLPTKRDARFRLNGKKKDLWIFVQKRSVIPPICLSKSYDKVMVCVLKAGCFIAQLLNNCVDSSPAAAADMLLSGAHSLRSPANYDICRTVMMPLSNWPHVLFLLLCTAHIFSHQPRHIYHEPVISWLWWSAFCLHPCILIKQSAARQRACYWIRMCCPTRTQQFSQTSYKF